MNTILHLKSWKITIKVSIALHMKQISEGLKSEGLKSYYKMFLIAAQTPERHYIFT